MENALILKILDIISVHVYGKAITSPLFRDQRDRSVTGRLHLSLSVIPDPEKCKNRIVIYHGPSTKIPLRSLS